MGLLLTIAAVYVALVVVCLCLIEIAVLRSLRSEARERKALVPDSRASAASRTAR